ncbi:ATP-binding protein [Sporosalibacterium faouarense]|uniref:ATP-binding protein n=1 Tax=Sporosalibacterium faouarense TaxID=516123 RepID=UPI00141C63D3|nr:4Fe-4S binding protein [Sporosalibacterium faouarense]MTI46520.1 4Fe-4S ferredoxin [Bacillota bacterium]
MAIREIVKINEEKCNGCGLCVPGCAEGAIKIVDGKAKLIADNLCDGIGNCIGHCPQDAIEVIRREADEFDEEAVDKHLSSTKKKAQPANTGVQKMGHGGHGHGGHNGGCPGSRAMSINRTSNKQGSTVSSEDIEVKIKPQLNQWPVQLKLVPESAPYLDGRDLLVTADCVPFAYPNYHLDLLKGKSVVIGCPKLDDVQFYIEKLTNMLKINDIKNVTVAHMEVPCCSGIVMAVDEAVKRSGKDINVEKVKIKINGERE